MSVEDCVDSCCIKLDEVFEDTDYDLSDSSKTTIKSIQTRFQDCVNSAQGIFQDSKISLIEQFKKELSDRVLEKWAKIVADAFCKTDTALREKTWAVDFYKGLHFLFSLKENCDFKKHLDQVALATSKAILDCSHSLHRQRLQSVLLKSEKNSDPYSQTHKMIKECIQITQELDKSAESLLHKCTLILIEMHNQKIDPNTPSGLSYFREQMKQPLAKL